MNKPEYLIVHHVGGTDANPLLDTSHATFESVNTYHKERFNFKSSLGFYIGYHYFIDRDGNVKQGRADTDEGAHTIGYNLKSLGICLAGNFDATKPTEKQVAALKTLLLAKMAQYAIPKEKVVPHRAFARKTCYGRNLSDQWAQEIVAPKPVPPADSNDLIRDEIRKKLAEVDTLLGKLK